MAQDLTYSIGLDTKSFASGIAAGIRGLGHVGLAIEGLKKIGAGFSSPIMKAAQFEKTTTAIQTLTKNASVTAKVMKDLTKLGAETPFEMSDLAPAARALIGAGTAASDVVKELRMLGDVASGADTDLGGLVAVFNQVRGKGRLMGGEFIQFAERGVAGLDKAIAKLEGIALNKVSDQIEKGKVSAEDLTEVFRRMTSVGGTFFNAMVNQSQTFLGKLSTMRDAWDMLLVKFATPIMDALKPFLDDAAKGFDNMQTMAAFIGTQMGKVVVRAREFVKEIGQGGGALQALKTAFGDLFRGLGDIAMIPIGAMAAGLPGIADALMSVMTPTFRWLGIQMDIIGLRLGRAMSFAMVDALRALPRWLISAESLQALHKAGNNMGKRSNILEMEDARKAGEAMALGFAGLGNKLAAIGATIAEEFEKRWNQQEGKMKKAMAKPDMLDVHDLMGVTGLAGPLSAVGNIVKLAYRDEMNPVRKALADNTKATKENTEAVKPKLTEDGRRKIMGYSWEKQGGAAEARKRAAQRVTDSRSRVEEQKGKWYHRAAGAFGSLMPQLPPGLGGGSVAAAGSRAQQDPQMKANNSTLDAILKELQRLRVA
jgi:hypothetical protein